MSEWKPWEWYPKIWPTESKFWAWLRGNIRKAIWNTSPIKITFKNENCSKPPKGYAGRAKSGAYCALSGEWEGKSKLECDHIEGNVSLLSEQDVLAFIKHMIPAPGTMQLVTKEAHKVKSYAERNDLTYEEAVVRKQEIEFFKKSVSEQKKLLSKHLPKGVYLSNKTKRLEAYRLIHKG